MLSVFVQLGLKMNLRGHNRQLRWVLVACNQPGLRPCAEALHSPHVREARYHRSHGAYSWSQNYAKIIRGLIDPGPIFETMRNNLTDRSNDLFARAFQRGYYSRRRRGEKANTRPPLSPAKSFVPVRRRTSRGRVASMGEITFRTCDTLYTRANSVAMTQRRLCWAIRESRLAVILSSDLKWERFLQRVCFI